MGEAARSPCLQQLARFPLLLLELGDLLLLHAPLLLKLAQEQPHLTRLQKVQRNMQQDEGCRAEVEAGGGKGGRPRSSGGAGLDAPRRRASP